MKIELQDFLNATGLGFPFLLTTLVTNLLNAAEEPAGVYASQAIQTCEKLRFYADRPTAPMPIQTIAAILNALAKDLAEPRYAALVMTVWSSPWDPKRLAHEIAQVRQT